MPLPPEFTFHLATFHPFKHDVWKVAGGVTLSRYMFEAMVKGVPMVICITGSADVACHYGYGNGIIMEMFDTLKPLQGVELTDQESYPFRAGSDGQGGLYVLSTFSSTPMYLTRYDAAALKAIL
jgi:hypothetical protein